MKTSKLTKKNNQVSSGVAIVEGERLIRQLLDNNVEIIKLYSRESDSLPMWTNGLNIEVLSDKNFSALCSTKTPQNLVALVTRNTSPIENYETLLYLDRISDPGNLGTILRTALALDIDGVAISPDSCDIFNPKVIRSSLGALFALPIEIKPYSWLAEQKAQKILADLHGTSIYDLPPLSEKKILIMGSEASGPSEKIKQIADITITIPISEKMESLNLAIATGICLSHIKGNK